MKLGVFAMIPQLNTKVLNGSHQHHQKAKKVLQKSKVKTMLVCFYDSKGIIHYEFVPEGRTVTGSFYLNVLERLMEEDSPCLARVLSTRQLVSSSRQCTGSPGSCCIRMFLARKQVCVLHHPPYSFDLSPCDYFLFPKLKLPLKGHTCLKMFKTSKHL